MKLSVLDLVPVLGGAGSPAALQQAVRLAQTAERLGYTRYWVAEHHDMPGLACTSPEVLLAHIGAHTERIRLGSGALLLPHYKPVKVAESFHLLASLYPGRIDLGIGRAPGGSAHVSMALSGNFLENVKNLPDSIEALLKFLANSYELEGQPVMARPIPPIPPEVWMLGTNRKSAAYASQFGTGYVFGHFMSDQDGKEVLNSYRSGFVPSPLAAEPRMMIAVSIVCAETEQEAIRLASSGNPFFKPEVPEEDNSPYSGRKMIIGSPQQVKQRLEEFSSAFGVEEFLAVTLLGDYESRVRSYELMAEAII